MPTRRQLIQKITLNADASSVTFSNIPQNYTDLRIVASTRSSFASTAISIKLRFNGSASDTNHSCRRLYGSGSSAASDTQAFSLLGVMGGSTSTSNTFSIHEAYIPNYTGSNNKTIQSKSATEENATTAYILQISNLFSSTSPITSIEVLDASGSFVANSTFYLYGITQVPIIRGGEVSIAGGFKYHTFRSSGSLQVIEPGDVEYLVVAGGGAGGNAVYSGGGGGGAGGLLTGKARLGSATHTVTVGAGGSGTTLDGNSGSNSSIAAQVISIGGGGGGGNVSTAPSPGRVGLNGGSGGGASGSQSGSTGGSATSGQGNNGGGSIGSSTDPFPIAGGGGGGAGGVGATATTSNNNGGNGGIGLVWPTGSSNYYAGGGGGGKRVGGTAGTGGSGGGGKGGEGTSTSTAPGGDGFPNSGGGGGGSGGSDGAIRNGGNGGSGIVIIRYPYDGN